MELVEAEINDLLQNGNLRIDKDVRWKLKKGSPHYEFHIPIENSFHGDRVNLLLIGTKNCWTKDYSFCILLDRQRIRGLCPYKKHTNTHPTKERINGTHKHKWIDQNNTSFAYKPDDISDVSNISNTFLQFLSECSIIMLGNFSEPPPIQYSFHLEGN